EHGAFGKPKQPQDMVVLFTGQHHIWGVGRQMGLM
ncbi:MAG: hypothetical protein ACI9VR_003850, partial [Cognaticolwellia sp.]